MGITKSPDCRSCESRNLETADEILSILVEMPKRSVGTSRSERIHQTNIALLINHEIPFIDTYFSSFLTPERR